MQNTLSEMVAQQQALEASRAAEAIERTIPAPVPTAMPSANVSDGDAGSQYEDQFLNALSNRANAQDLEHLMRTTSPSVLLEVSQVVVLAVLHRVCDSSQIHGSFSLISNSLRPSLSLRSIADG